MSRREAVIPPPVSALLILLGLLLTPNLAPSDAAQVKAPPDEKLTRNAAQRKLDSQILYHAKLAAGQPIAGFPAYFKPSPLETSSDGLIHVDIDIAVNAGENAALLAAIRALGGRVESALPKSKSVRAWIPLSAAETVAGRSDVRFVKPAQRARTNRPE